MGNLSTKLLKYVSGILRHIPKPVQKTRKHFYKSTCILCFRMTGRVKVRIGCDTDIEVVVFHRPLR